MRLEELFPDVEWNDRPERNEKLFQRAYCADDGQSGPFDKIVRRLDIGFSVLVYLPGNCMSSAAKWVRQKLTGLQWQEYLEGSTGQSILDRWSGTGSFAKVLKDLLEKKSGARLGVIAHNLDLLSDFRSGVYSHPDAQTALANLIEAARTSVVLGLADRDAGDLPPAIARVFNETVHLLEIPPPLFHRIIPQTLGTNLLIGDQVPPGAIWHLASRLRWTDPIRACQIMRQTANRKDLKGVLASIMTTTMTVEFELPDPDHRKERPTGFRDETLDFLERSVIRPYQQWAAFAGSPQEGLQALDYLPPGLILHGPPGTGKTMLAQWIANSIGLPYRTVSGSQIRASRWGEAERNVKDLFRDARRATPCVLILDDADDLLPDRDETKGGTASAERAVVNEFLQQLQGFRGRLDGVLVILTTNRFARLDRAAIERLGIERRIPYPLDGPQIEQIVLKAAQKSGLRLSEAVKNELVTRFSRPVEEEIIPDPYKAEKGLFSPRQITTALRTLRSYAPDLGVFEPTLENVRKLLELYSTEHPDRTDRDQKD